MSFCHHFILSTSFLFTGSEDKLSWQILNANPTPLREYVPAISPEVEWVVQATLAKDPTLRFGSMHAMVTALDQAGRPLQEALLHVQSSPAAQKPALGTPLMNYRDYVGGATAVAWSSDGGRVASVNDGVQIWQAL